MLVRHYIKTSFMKQAIILLIFCFSLLLAQGQIFGKKSSNRLLGYSLVYKNYENDEIFIVPYWTETKMGIFLSDVETTVYASTKYKKWLQEFNESKEVTKGEFMHGTHFEFVRKVYGFDKAIIIKSTTPPVRKTNNIDDSVYLNLASCDSYVNTIEDNSKPFKLPPGVFSEYFGSFEKVTISSLDTSGIITLKYFNGESKLPIACYKGHLKNGYPNGYGTLIVDLLKLDAPFYNANENLFTRYLIRRGEWQNGKFKFEKRITEFNNLLNIGIKANGQISSECSSKTLWADFLEDTIVSDMYNEYKLMTFIAIPQVRFGSLLTDKYRLEVFYNDFFNMISGSSINYIRNEADMNCSQEIMDGLHLASNPHYYSFIGKGRTNRYDDSGPAWMSAIKKYTNTDQMEFQIIEDTMKLETFGWYVINDENEICRYEEYFEKDWSGIEYRKERPIYKEDRYKNINFSKQDRITKYWKLCIKARLYQITSSCLNSNKRYELVLDDNSNFAFPSDIAAIEWLKDSLRNIIVPTDKNYQKTPINENMSKFDLLVKRLRESNAYINLNKNFEGVWLDERRGEIYIINKDNQLLAFDKNQINNFPNKNYQQASKKYDFIFTNDGKGILFGNYTFSIKNIQANSIEFLDGKWIRINKKIID